MASRSISPRTPKTNRSARSPSPDGRGAAGPPNGAELDGGQVLTALRAVTEGDFSVRLPAEWTGLAGKIADSFNEMVANNQRMARELERVSRTVGREGKINQRVSLGQAGGAWAEAEAAAEASGPESAQVGE